MYIFYEQIKSNIQYIDISKIANVFNHILFVSMQGTLFMFVEFKTILDLICLVGSISIPI